MSTPLSLQEQLELFAGRLGRDQASQLTPDEFEAAQRIVTALGQEADAILLAAACAREFHLDLPALADDLERPDEATLKMTGRPLTGGPLVAATAVRRGQVQRDRNDLAEAEHCFRWASERFHALGAREGESLALALLGRVAQVQERLEEAEQCYQQALALDRAVGNRHDEGVDLGLLAQVAWLRGMYDGAERLARQALSLHREERDWRGAAATLTTLGEVAQERGQRWRARLYFLRMTLAHYGFL